MIILLGKPIDVDKLDIFQEYHTVHSWTSSMVVEGEVLIITRKYTSMVTIEEFQKLTTLWT